VRKRKPAVIEDTIFSREPELQFDNHVITQGDLIKVRGEYGIKFKFANLVTNKETGATWVDCFEVFRGQVGAFRSFKVDRVKRIPKKRIKKKVA
jgi:hypothetical protein